MLKKGWQSLLLTYNILRVVERPHGGMGTPRTLVSTKSGVQQPIATLNYIWQLLQ